jgi:hypothetical protein
MAMTERDISQVLMVRSVEECDPDFFSPEMQLEALREAGASVDDRTLILKRASYLFQELPGRLQDISLSVHAPRTWMVSACISVFFLGILFNYLGPGSRVHILYNPVVLLLLWNIAVFLILLSGYFSRKKKQHRDVFPGRIERSLSAQTADRERQPGHSYEPEFTFSLTRWMIRKLWFSLHHQLWKRKRDMDHLSSALKTAQQYLDNWWAMNRRLVMSRFAWTVHILALCLVTGALTGIYIRGLFFEYNVVWKSTFIHDPGHISVILNILFGIPSLIMNGTFFDESHIAPLLRPGGEPAALWIHLFAMSTLMFVFPERLLLIFLEAGRIRGLTRERTINLSDPYYARYLTLSQDMQETRLQNEISYLVRAELSSMCESAALFTRDRFYDVHIVPLFYQFRQHGGRIRDLENEITRQSEKFRTELDIFLEQGQEDFRKSLSAGVSRILGKKLASIEVSVGNGIHLNPDTFRKALDASVTQKMTDFISVSVTAAVAAAAGTISGGFGKVLGIAIVSALLHTSGPIGFLIGALGGFLLGGGASVLAKDRITDIVKNREFPGIFTRILMRESKLNRTIEQARAQVYTLTKSETEEKLAPHREVITRSILSQIALPSRTQG